MICRRSTRDMVLLPDVTMLGNMLAREGLVAELDAGSRVSRVAVLVLGSVVMALLEGKRSTQGLMKQLEPHVLRVVRMVLLTLGDPEASWGSLEHTRVREDMADMANMANMANTVDNKGGVEGA